MSIPSYDISLKILHRFRSQTNGLLQPEPDTASPLLSPWLLPLCISSSSSGLARVPAPMPTWHLYTTATPLPIAWLLLMSAPTSQLRMALRLAPPPTRLLPTPASPPPMVRPRTAPPIASPCMAMPRTVPPPMLRRRHRRKHGLPQSSLGTSLTCHCSHPPSPPPHTHGVGLR
jgi:hypothetical protein